MLPPPPPPPATRVGRGNRSPIAVFRGARQVRWRNRRVGSHADVTFPSITGPGCRLVPLHPLRCPSHAVRVADRPRTALFASELTSVVPHPSITARNASRPFQAAILACFCTQHADRNSRFPSQLGECFQQVSSQARKLPGRCLFFLLRTFRSSNAMRRTMGAISARTSANGNGQTQTGTNGPNKGR